MACVEGSLSSASTMTVDRTTSTRKANGVLAAADFGSSSITAGGVDVTAGAMSMSLSSSLKGLVAKFKRANMGSTANMICGLSTVTSAIADGTSPPVTVYCSMLRKFDGMDEFRGAARRAECDQCTHNWLPSWSAGMISRNIEEPACVLDMVTAFKETSDSTEPSKSAL